MKSQVETRDDVVEKNAAAKKKGTKSFAKLKEEMAERENTSVIVKADDLNILDLSKLSKSDFKKKMKQLQDDHLLRGFVEKTKEALLNSPELAERQAVKRAKSDAIKEERGN